MNLPWTCRVIPSWCAFAASWFSNQTPVMCSRDSVPSYGVPMPMTPPQFDYPRTFTAVTPSVKPVIRLCANNWRAVCLRPSACIRNPLISCISSRLSNCFIPIGKVLIFSRSLSFPANTRKSATPHTSQIYRVDAVTALTCINGLIRTPRQ